MKNELVEEGLDAFIGAFRLGAALIVAAPIAIFVVMRNFVRREPYNPMSFLRSPPDAPSPPMH